MREGAHVLCRVPDVPGFGAPGVDRATRTALPSAGSRHRKHTRDHAGAGLGEGLALATHE